jgi:hypothetical protein
MKTNGNGKVCRLVPPAASTAGAVAAPPTVNALANPALGAAEAWVSLLHLGLFLTDDLLTVDQVIGLGAQEPRLTFWPPPGSTGLRSELESVMAVFPR